MAQEHDPCSLVIFGATGNLATIKLIPALFRLEAAGRLSAHLHLFAFARRDWTRTEWIAHLEKVLGGETGDPRLRQRFIERFDYVRGDLHNQDSYRDLRDALARPRPGYCENVAFYLAVRPADFGDVVARLDAAGFGRGVIRHRIVVEKPFGEDLESARQLNRELHEHFDEQQVYRIDHYLGKETVQNLLIFRFANTLIEPLWNRNYIDHVQITVAESIGIAERAGYFDTSGTLRDMVQNHLMQLLTMVAMEPPASLDSDPLRDEKVKVLRCLRPIPQDAVDEYVVRAQYAAGEIDGEAVPSYLDAPGVAVDSNTETFVCARLHIDNWRWRGVPFYLRSGKRLAEKLSLVAIRFRHPPPAAVPAHPV